MAKLLARYEALLLTNGQQIQQIESSLRSLTWFLPGRFADADVASEALYALVNVVSFYHTTLLGRILVLRHSNLSRLLRHLHATLPAYRRLARLLTLVRLVRVVVEMGALRVGGERWRWRAVLALEGVQAACRLALFHLSGGRRELRMVVPEREVDLSEPLDHVLLTRDATWTGERSGNAYLRLQHLLSQPLTSSTSGSRGVSDAGAPGKNAPFAPSAHEYLLEQASHASCHPLLLTRPLQGWEWWGELAHLLRPLAYVLALTRLGQESWLPWLGSAALDTFSLGTHIQACRVAKYASDPTTAAVGGLPLLSHGMRPTPLEAQEMRRRCWALAYYLLRNPFYATLTKHRLDAWIAWGLKRWVLSIGARVAQDYQPLWETYHFVKN